MLPNGHMTGKCRRTHFDIIRLLGGIFRIESMSDKFPITRVVKDFKVAPPIIGNRFWPGLGLPSSRPMLSHQKINRCQNIYGRNE